MEADVETTGRMKMKTSSTHPMILTAAGAVLVTCAVAVASMTGYLPESKADDAKAQVSEQAATADESAKATERSASAAVTQKTETKRATAASKPVYNTTPAKYESSQPTYKRAAYCGTCGQVTSVQQVQAQGEGTGMGAVAGGVTGAVIGKQFGNGSGQKAMTVIGAIGGAILGNHIEKNARATANYQVTVAFNDGTTGTYKYNTPPQWKQGDRVKVVNGQIMADL